MPGGRDNGGLGHRPGETLAVVEDESALRDVAGRSCPEPATACCRRRRPQAVELAAGTTGSIDLCVSDVVNAGMLGKELALKRLVDARPDTRVLTCPVTPSGARLAGHLDPGVALWRSRFTAVDLLTRAAAG
jgi:hypothetical protein